MPSPSDVKNAAQEIASTGLSKIAKGIAYAADNFPLRRIPLLGYFLSTRARMEEFSPTKAEDYTRKYAASVDFSGNITNSLNEYLDTRGKNSDVFSAIKTPNGKTIGEMLATENKEADEVRAKLAKVLNYRDEIIDADGKVRSIKNNNEHTITRLNELLHEKYIGHRLEVAGGYIKSVYNKEEIFLQDYNKNEKNEVEELFKDEEFTKNFKTALHIHTETDFENIKKEIVSNLDKTRSEELKKFTDSCNDTVKKLHEQAMYERLRIHWFAMMYHNSDAMRREIDNLINAKKATSNPDDIDISVSIDAKKRLLYANFKGLRIEDVPVVETITGRPLKRLDGGGYQLQLPPFNPFYYQNRHDQLEYDLSSLAFTVRALGKQSVNIAIKENNPKLAMELGRKAYLAAVAAGFKESKPDPKDPTKTIPLIKITVNGEELTAQKLFSKTSGSRENPRTIPLHAQLDAAKEMASLAEEQSKSYFENPIDYKTEFRRLRQEIGTKGFELEDKEMQKIASSASPAA